MRCGDNLLRICVFVTPSCSFLGGVMCLEAAIDVKLCMAGCMGDHGDTGG